MTFLGWLSDPFKGLSDLQLGDEKGTLNHLDGCCLSLGTHDLVNLFVVLFSLFFGKLFVLFTKMLVDCWFNIWFVFGWVFPCYSQRPDGFV